MKSLNFELSIIINELLLKSYSFNQENNFFDEFEEVLVTYEVSDKKYFLILNLIDFYEDAINHKFKELCIGYSIDQAKNDLLLLSNMLNNNNLEIPIPLYNRLFRLSL